MIQLATRRLLGVPSIFNLACSVAPWGSEDDLNAVRNYIPIGLAQAHLFETSQFSISSAARGYRGKTITPHGPVPAGMVAVTALSARFTSEMLFDGPLAE